MEVNSIHLYMALAPPVYYQPEKSLKLSKTVRDLVLEQAVFLRDRGIIPMLETENTQFDQKFADAVQYYSFYVIKMNDILGVTKAARTKDPKTMAEFFLKAIYVGQEQASQINDDLLRSTIQDAMSKMVDYFLLAREGSINVNKAKYNPVIGASFAIWVSILGLTEIYQNEKYKDKTQLVIEKCRRATETMQDYVLMIARDHGREFSSEVDGILQEIDSGKAKMITQTARELIRDMKKELTVTK
jgi:hypothetical protein